ncbi:DUF934 domain-containing protein [Parendozoicomonas sp. Alg238-R29]|uniref:DUF934 domain-containing protein n=1 Tax=Parendozoicomonas sp. Alg238-R29 TaxID=2993446 RepID=UPI00248EAA4C|nr:DUF934 domain-containing protein [Parendozoicomonas sp. Alg238-R29]
MHAQQHEILVASEMDENLLILEADSELEDIESQLVEKDDVAIRFQAFADGRGFSLARLLRERLNYTGKLRAIGDFLPDQMHYLARCGFDSFSLPEGAKAETAEKCLKAFSEAYQISWDRKEPLFRRL